MKPGSRSEFNYEQDVPDTAVGHASSDVGIEHPAGVLWVPDPEQRHWWREFYVRRIPDKEKRRIGFGR